MLCEQFDGHLQIQINDDGQGFEQSEAARRGGHFGLEIMKERAASIGGDLTVESQPHHGTTVTITVPVNPWEEPAELVKVTP